MEQIQCKKCKTNFMAKLSVDYPDDFGLIKCPSCNASWCWCKTHGRYEAPPPCPKCKEK